MPEAQVGLRYRRVTQSEALSLLTGLSRQGVDVEALYQALEQELPPDDLEDQTRFRQHRDFVLALARVGLPSPGSGCKAGWRPWPTGPLRRQVAVRSERIRDLLAPVTTSNASDINA